MKTKHAVVQKIEDLGKDPVKALGAINPQIVFAFGDPRFFNDAGMAAKLKAAFPNSNVVGCSTAGEICDDDVLSGSLVLTATQFDKANLKFATTEHKGIEDSEGLGVRLGEKAGRSRPESRLHSSYGPQHQRQRRDQRLAEQGRQKSGHHGWTRR